MVETTEHTKSNEAALRTRLGIPADAPRVLVFAESSHWDPNWLRTAREYFDGLVGPALEQALVELRADPRRIYSVECMYFLRMFWETHPELQNEVRHLLNSRRLRLTGTGVTTPDTLVPSGEAILRDLLIGQTWLRSIGADQEPRLAYFPDCFGHSPNLPALLNAAGFDRAAVTRIDGMWFLSADLDLPSNFPLKGSSAERLLKQERSLDFTWRAADGSEVLCHWNAFTYGQGDLLADAGQARIYLYPKLSKPDRSSKTVNRRVAGFVNQLAPLSRTPYMFCPIGWDFNPPITALNELLDRYNREVYPSSGVWLVNAGLDDYLDLVDSHRQDLPMLYLDPNPYWTGFYTSRPSLKQRCFLLWERLALSEQLHLLRNQVKPEIDSQPPLPALHDAWWSAAVSNHHDLVTGTSPDRVATQEQIPMLDDALSAASRACEVSLDMLRQRLDGVSISGREPASAAPAQPDITATETGLILTTTRYQLDLKSAGGGSLCLRQYPEGHALLDDLSQTPVQFNESGGLWRMGYEYRGGRFKEAALSLPPVEFKTNPEMGYTRVNWRSELSGTIQEHSLWIGRDDPLLYFKVVGLAPHRSTLTLRYNLPFHPLGLAMEAAGGIVRRPLARIYTRTFWPVQHFLHVQAPAEQAGFALLFRHPGAACVHQDGTVEVITQRNATREKAYWELFNLLGMPAEGTERDRTPFCAALAFPAPGEESKLSAQARALLRAPFASEEERLMAWACEDLVQVESDQVFVTAVKPAWRGDGIIVRLAVPAAPQPEARVRFKFPASQAWLCDTRERDLAPLAVEKKSVKISFDRSVVTLRILP